jgi:hypothetical protein
MKQVIKEVYINTKHSADEKTDYDGYAREIILDWFKVRHRTLYSIERVINLGSVRHIYEAIEDETT